MSDSITIGPQGSAADYIVDGVHDEVEMQAAIDKLKGSDSLEVKIVGNFGNSNPLPPVPEVGPIFHRMRTRALRGAEIRLDHIAEAEQEINALITKLLVKARIDELEKEIFASAGLAGFGHNPELWHKELGHYLENRLAELPRLVKDSR